ncbi:hypothetical protein GCM10025778_06980 [Paeniglutamicibacter antarcticus]|uniref:Uncharacterized protein n=2 Tax=Paeniglutamicibacter antarcticus TaxID=494023 RepID=A0ABP9TKB8_9MICC
MGLYVWGSTPMVLRTPAPGKDPEIPTHTGYRPWRVRETAKRAARAILWLDTTGSDPNFLAEAEAEHEAIDHIRLDAVGLGGFAVRRQDARPRFEANPAPLVAGEVPRQAVVANVLSTPSR